MTNPLRFLVLLVIGVAVALGMALASPSTPAYAQACDPSGSIDGTAEPSSVLPGGVITFTARGFTPLEEVSYWFTLPDGSVFGTAEPLCCAAPDGFVRFEPLPMPEIFFEFEGRWALTVQGASSQHQSIIYFCLSRTAQPTPIPPSPTTAPIPPTATSAPASPTTAPASPTVEGSPTAGATTTGVPSSPTVATSPTTVGTAVSTVEATATTMAPPTVMVPPTVAATPGTIGMPVAGAGGGSDALFYVGLSLVALSMMALGLMARRAAPERRRK
ncbi:MAG: hypothetical protein WCD37_15880 [Chloroflexia bacterium]